MAELDDARTLVPLAVEDLAPEDLVPVFHSASSTARKVPAVDFRNVTEGTPIYSTRAEVTIEDMLTVYAPVGGVAYNGKTITLKIAEVFGPPVLDAELSLTETSAGLVIQLATDGSGDSINEENTADLIAAIIGSDSSYSAVVLEGMGSENPTPDDYILAGGVDATTAKKGEELFDDDYRYLAVADVTVSSTSGWKTSPLTAL